MTLMGSCVYLAKTGDAIGYLLSQLGFGASLDTLTMVSLNVNPWWCPWWN